MKRVVVLLSALAIALTACSSDGSSSTTSAAAAEERIEIVDFAYSPDTVTVAVGTTVTWENAETGIGHTATSDEDVWTSGTLNEGDEFSFTFDEAGTFAYFCTIHPDMTGTIVVE
ncbi:MAG: cupredoxin domain-containing protein [Acidimicrobiia bacterium]